MRLISLDIRNVRNLEHVVLDPATGCNILYGANASGKTSILEAIYILGRGASFRAGNLRDVARRGIDQFSVFGKVETGETVSSLGVEYRKGQLAYRVAGNSANNRAELAEHLPLLALSPDSHRLLSEGPVFRRRYLDWGVFHVEHGFLLAWRRYQRALRQRNTALRSSKMQNVVTAWDQELCEMAAIIDGLRRDYLQHLKPYLGEFLRGLVSLENVTFSYFSGWREEAAYSDVLSRSLGQDIACGYTRYGPHHADVIIKVDSVAARAIVSRGQQKLLITAMFLAQAALLKEVTGKKCVILIDDLTAELDAQHRRRLLELLVAIRGQIFVTGTEANAFFLTELSETKVFHVEHGTVIGQVS